MKEASCLSRDSSLSGLEDVSGEKGDDTRMEGSDGRKRKKSLSLFQSASGGRKDHDDKYRLIISNVICNLSRC